MFPALTEPTYDLVDCFCGERSISHAFSNKGYTVASHDICLTPDDEIWRNGYFQLTCFWGIIDMHVHNITTFGSLAPAQDILSPKGFVRHLLSVMRLAAGGVCFLGPVCSSWVTINRLFFATIDQIYMWLVVNSMDEP